jgi:hypothetical protein
MRTLFVVTIAIAFALPIAAQAAGKGSGGSKTTVGSATGGSGAAKASPLLSKNAVRGSHYKSATIIVR